MINPYSPLWSLGKTPNGVKLNSLFFICTRAPLCLLDNHCPLTLPSNLYYFFPSPHFQPTSLRTWNNTFNVLRFATAILQWVSVEFNIIGLGLTFMIKLKFDSLDWNFRIFYFFTLSVFSKYSRISLRNLVIEKE